LLVKGCGRVVHGKVDNALSFASGATELADSLAGEEPGHGKAPQGNDHLWRKELDLSVKPLLAGSDLGGKGVSVPWGLALDYVADIDLVPFKPDRAEESIEELSRGTNEGTSLLVLVPPRCLADEDNLSVLRSLTGDRPGTVVSKLTISAAVDLAVKLA